MGGEIQQFASKCTNRILYNSTNNDPEHQQIFQRRTTNYENRR